MIKKTSKTFFNGYSNKNFLGNLKAVCCTVNKVIWNYKVAITPRNTCLSKDKIIQIKIRCKKDQCDYK